MSNLFLFLLLLFCLQYCHLVDIFSSAEKILSTFIMQVYKR